MNGSRSASGLSAPTWSGSLTEAGPAALAEVRCRGAVPRWEVPGWREEFGVVAGVTGRGEAGADYDLGLWTDQPVGQVSGRWREFLRAEPGFRAAVLAHQVHGARILDHHAAGPGWTVIGGADGHRTGQSGLLLLVTVADCVPVYLLDPVGGRISLVHAGWRGTAAGILEAGIRELAAAGGTPVEKLVMHCGVAISGLCYEVGPEVHQALRPGPEAVAGRGIDLRAVLAGRARGLGVRRVTVSPRCTATEAGDFFSHRRSGGRDGRQVAYLGIPDAGWPGHPL